MARAPIDILLVEDSDADAALVLHILRANNPSLKIEVARDGSEALDYLFATGAYKSRAATGVPRVVLLDLNLPKLSGIEVLQRIKTDPRTALVPVVMLTSSQSPADVTRSYQLGANGYMVKAADYEAFSDTLQIASRYWTQINRHP